MKFAKFFEKLHYIPEIHLQLHFIGQVLKTLDRMHSSPSDRNGCKQRSYKQSIIKYNEIVQSYCKNINSFSRTFYKKF